MREQNWAGAIEALSPFESQDPAAACQARLCRNLKAMQQHRSTALAELLSAPRLTTCEVVPTGSGLLTISQSAKGRSPMILTPGGEPGQALSALWAVLEKQCDQQRTLALCGIGDGYIAAKLSDRALDHPLGLQQVIHLIEPHVEVLWHAFMIHDFTHEDGLIASPRFHWWIGPDWQREFEQTMRDQLTIPPPEVPVRNSIDQDVIDAALRASIDELVTIENRWADRLDRMYAHRTGSEFAQLMRGGSGRAPRLLMLTTRFSTVLQHSARDLCRAFESLGWRVHMPIEPGDHHRNTRRKLLRDLLDFEPDLVMQIDHLRHEHGRMFPAALPFACWIQDDLPNLTSRSAGAKIGPRDFVLTASERVYISDYGYPQEQCVHFTKQTHWQDTITPAVQRRDWLHDISYVSNASQQPSEIAATLPAQMCRQVPLQRLAAAVCDRILNAYDQGEVLYAVGQVRALLAEESKQVGVALNDEDLASSMAIRIFASLNNALHRQQALSWTAEIVREKGWSLGLYGSGWEAHPTLGAFARGSVAYGSALADITARSKVNLQIVPYSCIHQRLLDGLSAGGFFLIRRHPMDTLASEFVKRAGPLLNASINDVSKLRSRMENDEDRAWLDDWMQRYDLFDDHRGVDPVQTLAANRADNRGFVYEPFPDYEATAFGSRAELAAQLERFLNEDESRDAVCQRQRTFVKSHFTYEASLTRAIERMAGKLEASSE